ncbi:CbtA family protein [Streptomyces sp. B1866]|uniref:CbtA family protein n=1 Tax=Streptomyces sp. B1866 TaxID=3075431 RepID=UPI00288D0A3B|nr:CbtA family protein [Streptomyces sp. B1866]MDT3396620.1 CbtA family protein [Streptomyces sp. B1866]
MATDQGRDLPVLPLLGRGLAAGGLAGLATGLFSLLLTEPLMDRAVKAEERRTEAEHGHEAAAAAAQHHEELFTRGTQHLGLVVTAVVVGLAIGVFFAVAYALVHRRTGPEGLSDRAWPRAWALTGAGFAALSLLPGLRYPANPPGVGDSGTLGHRQELWLGSLAVGVLGVVLAWQVSVRLAAAGRSAAVRQTAVAATLVAVLAVSFALPDNTDPVPVEATLLWDFRVLGLASHVLLWALLGGVFGALGLRAARARERAAAGAAQKPEATVPSPA